MTWITTHSGGVFNFQDWNVSSICIEDIAHALSNICRFTGHTRKFYSVAQHSVYVSRIVPPAFAFAGLMHDGAEAYLGDVSAPLKALLPDYKKIEREIEYQIGVAFGLSLEQLHATAIKAADIRMLATEKRDLVNWEGEWEVLKGITPISERLVPWEPVFAEAMFLARFNELHRITSTA